MAGRVSFAADEWAKIVGSPILAGMAGALADQSRSWGSIQKGMVSALALLDAKRDACSSHLIKAVVAELETVNGRAMARGAFKAELTGRTPAELTRQTIAALSSVNLILDAKAGSDGPTFKLWLDGIAERVAGASNVIVLTVAPLQRPGSDCPTTLR
jgi:hypothetical protein